MAFLLQTAALHETDETFAFAMHGDDLAIKKRNTGTTAARRA